MDELVRQLLIYLRGMWRSRWIGVAAAWLVCVLGTTVVFFMPDKWEASARVFVDTQSLLKPLMSGLAVQPNVEQQIAMLSRTLISRPNIEKLIRQADLDLQVADPAHRERLIDDLMKALEIKRAGSDNLYTLHFRDTDTDRARRVVQELVSIFIESSAGSKLKDTDSARRFIEDQISQYEKKLAEGEARMKDFKLKNMNLNSEVGRDYFSQLRSASAQLEQAQLELREVQQSRDALKRQLSEQTATIPTERSGKADLSLTPEIDERLKTLKENLDNLLQRFTDQHPDVIAARRMVASLEDQRRDLLADIKAKGPAAIAEHRANPVVQQIKIALAEAEANVASLQARTAEYERRLGEIKSASKLVPEMENELAQMNRDYEVQKRQYETLVARREAANISGDMDATTGAAEFRLVDPPRVSPTPVAPNRVMLLLFVLLGSVGAGFGSAFLMTQVRPVFYDQKTVREITGLPVLGSVCFQGNVDFKATVKRQLAYFYAALLGLGGTFGVAMVVLILTARAA